MKYCCSAFEENINQFEKDDEGFWNIEGCCGVCYVLVGVKFCPFCGSRLRKIEVTAKIKLWFTELFG